jgi:biopolymer transport protein ExbD
MQIRRRKKLFLPITLITMADIAFLLLIFFICAGAANMDDEPEIILPDVLQAEIIERPHRLDIWINKDGDIRILRRTYTLEEAEAYLLRHMRFYPETYIGINSDERCAFARIEDALAALRRAGALRVVFMTREGLNDAY